jgi:polysaccharide export outer membrane protein
MIRGKKPYSIRPVLHLRILSIFSALTLLAGCSTLPNVGPSKDDVIAQQVTNESGLPLEQRYEIVDITPAVANLLMRRAPDSFVGRFGDYRPSTDTLIGIGDLISVTVWEAGAGGLFSAPLVTDRFTTGSKSATIPEQVVGRDGSISVPYAGRIRVAGQTVQSVQARVEHALEGKAIQPQVIVNVVKPISNTVTVTGEVAAGALVPLSPKGDRLLEVVAAAGGLRAPVNETFARLSRGSKTVTVPLAKVTADPRENIYMRPGDVLTLVRNPQFFVAYGATGRNAEIPFEADGINLSRALAKAGGLLDYRADPAGVFIFRYEPEYIARMLRPDSLLVQHNAFTPIVYRLDLHDANALFVSQSFPIFNNDVLYTSNAPMADFQKALGVFSTIVAPAATGAGIATAVK